MHVPYLEVHVPLLHASQVSQESTQGNRDVAVHPLSLEKDPSPINLTVLKSWLALYPIRVDILYLLDGFTFCFHIPYQSPRDPYITMNLKSIVIIEAVFRDKIDKE